MQLNLDDIRYSGRKPEELREQDALLVPGDLLFTRYSGSREYVGVCAHVPDSIGTLTYPDKLIRARVPLIDSRYLAAAFASPLVRSSVERALRTTAGQVGISGSSLKSVGIPIAPEAEQRRIVAALEEHLSRVDAGMRLVHRASWRLGSLAGAMRDDALKGAPEAVHGTLADVLERIEAGKSFGGATRPALEDEWGIIKVSAMTWGEFRPSENKLIEDTDRVDPRYEIKPGDVLVSRANTEEYVGAPVMVKSTRRNLLLSDKSLRLVPKPGIDRSWLIEILASPMVRKQISEKAAGTKDSMRNISQASLKEVRIPLHDESRQLELVALLAERTEAAGRLGSELSTAEALGARLRRSLLADAFAGRLVPQDPTDEPASVLLQRIRAERSAQPKPNRSRRAKNTNQETLL
jgi:type I restriction enzyme S subunit